MNQDVFERPISDLVVGETPIRHHPYTPVSMVIESMQREKKGAVVILDEEKVVGIITERDLLLKVLRREANLGALLAKDIMVENPKTVYDTDSVRRAILYMRIGGFRHLVVLNHGNECMSILSVKDIINYLSDAFELKVR